MGIADLRALAAAAVVSVAWTGCGGGPHRAVAAETLSFHRLWVHEEPGAWMVGVPTVADGFVYEGTSNGDVLALDARTGAVRWRAHLGANPDAVYGKPRGVISSVAVAGGVAYAVSGSCVAAAFDARSGHERWRTRVCSIARNDDTYASPVVAGGRIFIGIDVLVDRPTDVGREIALDARNGRMLWSFTPVRYRGSGAGISATPVVDAADGIGIVGTGNPTPMTDPPPGPDPYSESIIGFDLRSGAWRWVFGPTIPHDTGDYDFFASPLLFHAMTGGRMRRVVCEVQKDGVAFALDPRTGRLFWRRRLLPAHEYMLEIGTPAYADGYLYVPFWHGGSTGALLAVRARDGRVRWRDRLGGIYGAPAVHGGIVYAALADGALIAVRASDGRVLARTPLAEPAYIHGIAVAGNLLLVPDREVLYAFRI